MPDYKRKKIKKSSNDKRERHRLDNDIIMSPKKTAKTKGIVPEDDIKVIRGSKYNRSVRNKFFFSFLAIIAAIYLVLHLILPVSVYENFLNITSIMGHGKYPISISGNSVIDCVSQGQYYYLLTDTSICAYSNNGKLILSDMHGFSNPIISISDTRAIVYDQGGKVIYVYNLGGRLHKLETEQEIITASISRNGELAVSTHSDSFASVVNVYDKNLKQIFTWNSAKDIVNNVLVNPSGNRLAISVFNVSAGQYTSKMMILNFESADPLHTIDLGNSIALSLTNTGKGVSIITADNYKFVHWTKFTTNDVKSSGQINLVRKADKGLLLVFNRANDRSDNTVVLISNKGIKTGEFSISDLITDIQYSKGRVYYISDTFINILDGDGNVLRNGSCEYGTKKFAVISSNSTAIVTDTEIVKTNIEKGEN